MTVEIEDTQDAGVEEEGVFELVIVPMDELSDSEHNAKEHTEEQIEQIRQSIIEFGFRDPIAVDANMEIVEGHGRVEALRKMGVTEVPALVFRDLSPEQIRAYRIAHNQLTLSTPFDFDKLSTELQELDGLGVDLTLTGFSEMELSAMDLDFVDTDEPPPSESTGAPLDEGQGLLDLDDDVSSEDATPKKMYPQKVTFDTLGERQEFIQLMAALKDYRPEDTPPRRLLGVLREVVSDYESIGASAQDDD